MAIWPHLATGLMGFGQGINKEHNGYSNSASEIFCREHETRTAIAEIFFTVRRLTVCAFVHVYVHVCRFDLFWDIL